MKVLISDKTLRGALFTVDGMPVSPELRDALVADGYRIIEQDHPEWRDAAIAKMDGAAAYRYGARSATP